MSLQTALFIDIFGSISSGWINLFTIAGLPLTLLGLTFTWRQAKQAKSKATDAESAANSLKEAVDAATLRIARQDLASSLAQTRLFIRQLSVAEKSASVEFAEQTLVQLSDHLSHVVALSEKDTTDLVPKDMVDRMLAVRGLTLKAKDDIARDRFRKISIHIQSLRTQLEALGADLRKIETISQYDHTC